MSSKMKSMAVVLAALLSVGPALALAQGAPELRRTQTNPNKGKKSNSSLHGIPVSGVVIEQLAGTLFPNVPVGTPFSGTLDIVSFKTLPGMDPNAVFTGHAYPVTAPPQIAAVGVVTGLVGGQLVSRQVEFPIAYAGAAGACDILNLLLGPLNLNILGLVITLNQIDLDIIAVPGAGNLLGNLLCAVVGLLDGIGTLGQIIALLDAIADLLAILGL